MLLVFYLLCVSSVSEISFGLYVPSHPFYYDNVSQLRRRINFQKDYLFIGFNKLASAPFAYFFLRYAFFEKQIIWDLNDITVVSHEWHSLNAISCRLPE